MYLLLWVQFLPPQVGYALIKARLSVMNLNAVLQLLLACIMGCLKDEAPVVPILGALYMEDHITK